MIYIASDHTGFELKKYIIEYLSKKKILTCDLTKEFISSDDYPDIAEKLCEKVLKENTIGIGICGTGIGMSIACNKIKKIRAALCTSHDMVAMAIKHNNANVICMGARLPVSKDKTEIGYMLDELLINEFEEDRHIKRIEKIAKLEEK